MENCTAFFLKVNRSIEAVREIFRQYPALGRPDEELLLLL